MQTMSYVEKEIGIDPEVLGWNILIRKPKFTEQLTSGIFLPNGFSIAEIERKCNIAKVLKIGPDCFSTPSTEAFKVKEGDWIWYAKLEQDECTVVDPRLINNHKIFMIMDDRIKTRHRITDLPKLLGCYVDEDFEKEASLNE